MDVRGIDKKTYDLSVKNPDGGEEIAVLDAESAKVLKTIRRLL